MCACNAGILHGLWMCGGIVIVDTWTCAHVEAVYPRRWSMVGEPNSQTKRRPVLTALLLKHARSAADAPPFPRIVTSFADKASPSSSLFWLTRSCASPSRRLSRSVVASWSMWSTAFRGTYLPANVAAIAMASFRDGFVGRDTNVFTSASLSDASRGGKSAALVSAVERWAWPTCS